MKVWTDREGKAVSGKEFFHRWKEGMQKINPQQQTQTMFFGQWIVFAGILFGLVMTFRLKQWWLFTILIGSTIITLTQMLGTWQKMMIFSKMEKYLNADSVADSTEEMIDDSKKVI